MVRAATLAAMGAPARWRGAALLAPLGLAAVVVAAAGCVPVAPFTCADSSACVRAGEQGTCEPTGWCSFPDADCDSGRRYGAGAGDLSGACVDAGQPQRDGGHDATSDAAPDGGADAPAEDAAPADAAGDTAPCVEAELVCAGDELRRCQGGAWTVADSCALGCKADAVPARCYTFAPRNVAAAALTTGTFDWVVTDNLDVGTGGGNLPSGVGRTVVAQADGARDLTVLTVRSLWVKPGVILRFTGTSAVAVVASDSILVEGAIDVSGSGATAGPGGWGGGTSGAAGYAPASATRAPDGLSAGSYYDSGGSGGCFATVGGNGGAGGSASPPGLGTVFGTTSLTPLFGGGGGGAGSGSPITTGGDGGGGGGALQLTAAREIVVAGVVIAAGAGGGPGGAGINDGSGAGGGAGGGLLLEAPVVVLSGALAANGGGGGGAAYNPDGPGTIGTAGLPNGNPAPGGAGGKTGDPTVGGGGSGGAATTAAAAGLPGQGSGANGGGGGGGLGRIVVANRTATTPGGTVSPAPTVLGIVPQ